MQLREPAPGRARSPEVMDPPRTIVARRLERYAVRDVEAAQRFEQFLVPHAVLEGDEHGPAFECRSD